MNLFCFRMIAVCLIISQGTVAVAVTISRDRSGTTLHFQNSDLLKLYKAKNYEGEWIAKNNGFRLGCPIQTPSFNLSSKASAELVIRFEAYWRDLVDDVLDATDLNVARFDLVHTSEEGMADRESYHLLTSEIGNMVWLSKSDGFVEIRAQSGGVREIHMTGLQIPAGSKNLRIKVCGIAPRSTLRIDSIELRLNAQEDAPLVVKPAEGSLLNCFNTGLFLTNCNLDETVLSAKNNVDLEYETDILFDCRGHDVEFGLKTDESFTPLKPSKERQKLKVTGTELKLVDLNPAKTNRATFDLGCTLHIGNTHKRLSARAKVTLKNYLQEVRLLTQVLRDIHSVDSLTKDLTIAMLQTNPGQLIWAAKSLTESLTSLLPRVEDSTVKSELQVTIDRISTLTLDDKFESESDLQKKVSEVQKLLKETLDKRIKAIFRRLEEIQLRIAELSALLDADEKRAEEDAEQEISEARKTFL